MSQCMGQVCTVQHRNPGCAGGRPKPSHLALTLTISVALYEIEQLLDDPKLRKGRVRLKRTADKLRAVLETP